LLSLRIPARRDRGYYRSLISTATHKRDNFHAIPRRELRLGMLPAWNKIQIAFHGQHPRIKFQFDKQLSDGGSFGKLAFLAVDG
jgi:hypothetical protein